MMIDAPNDQAADADQGVRLSRLSRRFITPQLEQRYRAYAFPLGRRRVVRLVLLFVALEVYVIVSSFAREASIMASMRLDGTRYVGLSIQLATLAILLSKFNSPSRLPVLMWLAIACYVVSLVAPMLADGGAVLTGRREHDASWVVGSWYLAAVATAVLGEWGMMGPAGSISLFWIATAFHGTTMALAYAEAASGARGQFGAFVPHMVAAGCINAYLAWACCEASRQVFLACHLAAAHRMEQLSREKERLDYERRFAEMKLCQASSSAAGAPGGSPEGAATIQGTYEAGTPFIMASGPAACLNRPPGSSSCTAAAATPAKIHGRSIPRRQVTWRATLHSASDSSSSDATNLEVAERRVVP